MARSKDMAAEVYRSALRTALEVEAAKVKETRWTPEIDADILYARDTLNLSMSAIAATLKATFGWGSRCAVDNRLRTLRGK